MIKLKWVNVQDIAPSPFQTRRELLPITSTRRVGVISPPKIRVLTNGPRTYESVTGYRRIQSSKGKILCEVVDQMDDETASLMVGLDNLDRADLSQAELGEYFARMKKTHGWSDEELSDELGGIIAPRTIEKDIQHWMWSAEMQRRSARRHLQPLESASARTRTKSMPMPIVPFNQCTKHEQEELRKLPKKLQEQVAARIIGERFSERMGLALIAKAGNGVPLDRAVAQVVNVKEKMRQVRYHQRRRRLRMNDTNPPAGAYLCIPCGDTVLVECLENGKHKLVEEKDFLVD